MSAREPHPGRTLDLIRSKSFEGRKALIAELRNQRTDQSVALLVELLSDESWSLRELAAAALIDVPELAAPHLHRLLDRGLWYTRAAAARALGVMSYGPALPSLLRLLVDRNQTIATEAARGLLEMASRGRAVSVARGILMQGSNAGASFAALEHLDPDAGRKVRILAARDDVAAPVRQWLVQESPDPEVLEDRLARELDDEMGVQWKEISGPVGA